MVNELRSGSVFWIVFILLAFTGLFYLGIWGFFQNSMKAIALSTIFGMVLIFGIVATKFEIFTYEMNFFKSCAAFTAGFFIWFLIVTIIKSLQSNQTALYSIFSAAQLQKSGLFAVIAGELPVFWDYVVNNLTIPVVEELFWLITLPVLLIMVFDNLSGKISWMESKVFRITAILIVCGVSFAFFHIGKVALIGFMISAIIFRSILLIIYWGDRYWNLFPFTAMLASFAVGAHIGNNIADTGLTNFIVVMQSQALGWFLMALFALIFALGVYYMVRAVIAPFKKSDVMGGE